jgi:biopolymer transport protein ExbD
MHLKVVSLDRVYGPVDINKLVALAAQGRIAPGDLVRPASGGDWIPVTQVPAIAAALPMEPEILPEEEEAPVAVPSAAAEEEEAGAGAWTPRRRKRRAEEPVMDMAPMIDVTFLLLIFFMLTNTMAQPAPMDVPQAVHGRGVNLEGQQMILIDRDGNYYLGEMPVPENAAESLEALVQEVGQNAEVADAAMDVIVNAHKETRHGQVRELVERLGQVEGLRKIMVGVEEQPF